MLNAIRKTIAAAIAPKTVTVDATPQQLATARSVTTTTLSPRHHLMTQHERAHTTPRLPGRVSVSDLDNLTSEYLRDSIASYGAWIALAKAFSEYEKVTGRRNADDKKLNALLDEFHCWNAATSNNKQMDEIAIAEATTKLCQPKPQQSNEQTDAIIARVKGCSIAELKDQRIKQLEQQKAKREACMDGFLATVWSFTSSDLNPALSGIQAEAKAIQTMEFVANTWTGNPASIAAELLLMESDMRYLNSVAQDETRHEGQGPDESERAA